MSAPRFTFAISTMGCKANLSDTQILESRLMSIGGKAVDKNPDIYIMNSCTVTDKADRDALKSFQQQESKLNIFTGCLAEVQPDVLKDSKEKSRFVVSNSSKVDIPDAINKWLEKQEIESVLRKNRSQWHKEIDFEANAPIQAKSGQRTRAFIKVQDGCNQFCSFCIIPKARGRSRSLESDKIVAEINALNEQGIQEVVLTAIHAADYDDNGMNYFQLVEKILAKTKIVRIRLTSLDPHEIEDEFLELMQKNGRICPHFHISIQSANSRVLESMRRKYNAEDVVRGLKKIQSALPHAFVGLDVIAGFPGETEEEFESSFQLLENLPWTRMHVFPYSIRSGTHAARLVEMGEGVIEKDISLRAKRLRRLSEKRHQQHLESKVGSLMEILTEQKTVVKNNKDCSQGYSRSYYRVLLKEKQKANQRLQVRIASVGPNYSLLAE